MQGTTLDAEGYLDAFMNGFEFVLLAIRGRLAEENVPAGERARLEAFLADYWRIVRAYQERQAAPPTVGFPMASAFRVEMSAVAPN